MNVEFLTNRDLQRLAGLPRHVIAYAIVRFGPEPAARIGHVRVWTYDQLPLIHAALSRTAVRSTSKERRVARGDS